MGRYVRTFIVAKQSHFFSKFGLEKIISRVEVKEGPSEDGEAICPRNLICSPLPPS